MANKAKVIVTGFMYRYARRLGAPKVPAREFSLCRCIKQGRLFLAWADNGEELGVIFDAEMIEDVAQALSELGALRKDVALSELGRYLEAQAV